MRRLEDVFEDAFYVDPGTFVCVYAKRAETKIERTDVIKSEDVIGVTVCDENGVELL
jgi:hypothetical protein